MDERTGKNIEMTERSERLTKIFIDKFLPKICEKHGVTIVRIEEAPKTLCDCSHVLYFKPDWINKSISGVDETFMFCSLFEHGGEYSRDNEWLLWNYTTLFDWMHDELESLRRDGRNHEPTY